MRADVRTAPQIGSSGYCPQFEALAQRGGRWTVTRFPASWLLVSHPTHGPVLVDCGYGEAALAVRRSALGFAYNLLAPMRWTPAESTATQLAVRGVPAHAVRHIVVTHWHVDHVGALEEFPHATLHTDVHALRHLQSLRLGVAAREGFFARLCPPAVQGRVTALPPWGPAPPWLAPFVSAAPVLDDDSLWAVPLPGHARGHIGVAGRTPEGTVWLWAADAAWRRAAYLHGALPPAPVLRMACPDIAAYHASVSQLRAFAQRRNVRVAVAHDSASWDGWDRL
jgi:glyoxylase-like metal-dependent hydrolase (beta-lactamase superfamily II)